MKVDSKHANWMLAVSTIVATLLIGEVVARIWVAIRWPEHRVDFLTTVGESRGRFESHEVLPYVHTRGWISAGGIITHNDLGFRGPPLAMNKPAGVVRIALIGGSTTYGTLVSDEQTVSARLLERLTKAGIRAEVINAGVGGYTSEEILLHLEHRVLPISPDVVVAYLGRNEVFVQGWNEFRADYGHFRNNAYDFSASNQWIRRANRTSHLLLVLGFSGGRHGFGWSHTSDNPVYGSVFFERKPTSRELIDNLLANKTKAAYAQRLEAIVERTRAAGAKVLFATMAFVPAKFGSGMFDDDPSVLEPVGAQMRRNNDTMRDTAAKLSVALVETATLAAQRIEFWDDCHAYAKGLDDRAAMIFDAIMTRDLLP